MSDKTDRHAPSSRPPEDDAATRLLRRGALTFVVGGFFVLTVPQAAVGIVSGETERVAGSALSLALWAWLTWRTVLLLRRGVSAQDPHYWSVSVAGYLVFLVVYIAWAVWQSVTDGFEPRSVSTIVILSAMTLITWLAGRRAAERISSG